MPAGTLTLIKPSSYKKNKRVPKLVAFKSVATSSKRSKAMGLVTPGYFQAQPFTNIKRCSVVYAGEHTIFSGVAGLFGTEVKYSLNGLFDVDISGVGHQPMGFDQLMAIYSKYKVNRAKVIIQWSDPSGDGLTIGHKLNTINDASVLGGMSLNKARELTTVRTKPISDSGSQRVIQTFTMPMNQLMQVTKLQFDANSKDYTGSSGANPIESPTISLACINTRDATNISILCNIKIVFYCQFYQRKTLGQS